MRATVAHTLPDFAHGGGQTLLRRTIAELTDFDHVVVGRAHGPMIEEFRDVGAQVEVFDQATPVAVAKMVKTIRTRGIGLVHTNNTPPDRLCGQLGALATGTPVINTFHSFPTVGTGVAKAAQRLVNKALCRVGQPRLLAVSQQCGRAYADVVDLAPDTITVAYPGITDQFFEPAPPPDPPLPAPRQPVTGLPSPVRLISVCRLTNRKGVGTVIDAFSRLVEGEAGSHAGSDAGSVERSVESPVELLIAGDGAERDCLEAQVDRLSLANQVHFLGHRDDVASLLQASDVFVTATETEGFGMSVVEAMACGLPVVAMELPVWSEFLTTDNARVASTTAEFAAHLHSLSADADLRTQLGQQGAQDAQSFRIAARARELAGIYRSVLDGTEPATGAAK